MKEFNDRVVLVLINNINDYLTRIGIDMGLDENVTWKEICSMIMIKTICI